MSHGKNRGIDSLMEIDPAQIHNAFYYYFSAQAQCLVGLTAIAVAFAIFQLGKTIESLKQELPLVNDKLNDISFTEIQHGLNLLDIISIPEEINITSRRIEVIFKEKNISKATMLLGGDDKSIPIEVKRFHQRLQRAKELSNVTFLTFFIGFFSAACSLILLLSPSFIFWKTYWWYFFSIGVLLGLSFSFFFCYLIILCLQQEWGPGLAAETKMQKFVAVFFALLIKIVFWPWKQIVMSLLTIVALFLLFRLCN